MLGFLVVALLLSHLDRHILAIALQRIKIEFALTDTQLGVLSGLPFAVVFVLFGFIAARVAQPGRYATMVTAALVVWSGATIALGLSGGFLSLLLFRMVVGAGEAVAVPASHAMISQAYPPNQRASALAIFQSGASLGLFFAFVLGGLVVGQFGWRAGFIMAGGAGFLFALPMAFGLREIQPDTAPGQRAAPRRSSLPKVWHCIWSESRGRLVLTGMVLASVVSYGGISWFPAYLHRVHELPLPEVGLFLALTVGLIGAIGTWFGGALSDRREAGKKGGRLRFVALTLVLAKLGAVGFYLLGGAKVALFLFLLPALLNSIYIAPSMSEIYAPLTPQDRPTATAIMLFLMHLFGLGLGPMLVGLISDAAQGTVVAPLGLGLLTLQMLGIAAALCFWRAAGHGPGGA